MEDNYSPLLLSPSKPPNIALINIMPSNYNFLFNKYYETRCLDYILYTHKFTMLNQSQAN